MPPKEYDMYSDPGKAVKRSSAVDYENIVRKILGVEKRPYDAAHSPLGIGPTIK